MLEYFLVLFKRLLVSSSRLCFFSIIVMSLQAVSLHLASILISPQYQPCRSSYSTPRQLCNSSYNADHRCCCSCLSSIVVPHQYFPMSCLCSQYPSALKGFARTLGVTNMAVKEHATSTPLLSYSRISIWFNEYSSHVPIQLSITIQNSFTETSQI